MKVGLSISRFRARESERKNEKIFLSWERKVYFK